MKSNMQNEVLTNKNSAIKNNIGDFACKNKKVKEEKIKEISSIQ